MDTDTDNIARLRGYLNHKARIAITDGRVFIGTFVCTDKQKNIILAHTTEYRGDEHRIVGLVMIPGKHLVKMEIEDLESVIM
ncbi:hypothetical protein O0I10_001628 [Lichtheimia ornata]|uniref:Sm domain-containing protein n=1 Tax=Lichtheimia ornata TaxID=688661 RepID=A0AAD7VAZ6_9FUNG|nr:uncharacterized protein O0I10_001628 [Lichtheimia ornata]KAJ8662664.1 hypothetical protein O0I10_001628 [Lichtheimia ornata]